MYDTVALFAEVNDGEAGRKHAVELLELSSHAGKDGEREGSSLAAKRVWVSLTFSGGIGILHGGGGVTTGSELPACNLVYGMTGLNIVATVHAPNAMKRRKTGWANDDGGKGKCREQTTSQRSCCRRA